MDASQPNPDDDFLLKLLATVENIANTGDLQSVQPLLAMTAPDPQHPLFSSLAEAFAKMLVKLEAREFQLEGTIEELTLVKGELELANYDSLTGLPNRVIARDRLRQGLALARRSGCVVAVMYLDLDRFKWVNDNLGHAAGDDLLRQVAQRLRGCVREVDTVARLGGDEFLCVLTGLQDDTLAHEVASRIVASLAEPFALGAERATIGVSLGIALFPQHGGTQEQLLQCADVAMYRAKDAGRNGFCVFTAAGDP